MKLAFWRRRSVEPAEEIVAIIPEDEEDRALIRQFAERIEAQLEHANQMMVEGGQALTRWLLASLLTLNGGAVIALLSSNRLADKPVTWPSAMFVAGCVFAILTGLHAALSFNFLSPVMGQARGRWFVASRAGEVTVETQTATNTVHRAALRFAFRTVLLGLTSLGFFVAGAIWTGIIA